MIGASPVCARVNHPILRNSGTAAHELLMLRLRTLHSDVLLTFLAKLLTGKMEETPERITVVAPHQDDETFGCGGLIAKHRKRGSDVQVIFLTDGSQAPLEGTSVSDRRELPAVRNEEARRALASLGVPGPQLHFLDYQDGALHVLDQTAREGFLERLAGLLTAHGSTMVLLPHWNDGHSDHDAAHELAAEAAGRVPTVRMVYQYMIWKPWLHPLYRPGFIRELSTARRLSIADVIAKKKEAIEAYDSQLATLPRGFLNRFERPYELFLPDRIGAGGLGGAGKRK